MSIYLNGAVAVTFQTRDPVTQALTNATGTPTGTLYRNGAADGAVTVTVTNVTTGVYKAAFTVPSGYAVGDVVEVYITATVSGVADTAKVWGGTVDAVMRGTDGANTTTPPTADNIATAVWNALTSGMVTVGSIGKKLADVVFNWSTGAIPSAQDNANALLGTDNGGDTVAEQLQDAAQSASGDGDTIVDQDTGGAGNLRCVDSNGDGIDNAIIKAYLTSEYAAGNYVVRATTTTDSNGDWVSPMMLNSGLSYTLVASKSPLPAQVMTVTV